jgi:APA family basic amino acid/polyamine antiporter
MYMLAATVILIVLILYRTSTTWPGLLIVLTGIPVYFIWHGRGGARGENSSANG